MPMSCEEIEHQIEQKLLEMIPLQAEAYLALAEVLAATAAVTLAMQELNAANELRFAAENAVAQKQSEVDAWRAVWIQAGCDGGSSSSSGESSSSSGGGSSSSSSGM